MEGHELEELKRVPALFFAHVHTFSTSTLSRAERLAMQTTTLPSNTFLYIFLSSPHHHDVKKFIFTFYGGHKQATVKFSFFLRRSRRRNAPS